MNKKLSRGAKLLILLGVLAIVLTAALIFIPKAKDKATPPIARVSGESIKQIDTAKMSAISWIWGEERYDFTVKDGVFTCNLQNDYVTDRERLDTILEYLRDIRAEKIIDEPMVLSTYGLDQPALTVTVDGYTMNFGDQSLIDGTYYMSCGDGKVYMLDQKYFNCFAKTREEMVALGTVPDLSAATKITVQNAEGTMVLVKDPDSGKAYSGYYQWSVEGSDVLIYQDYVQQLMVDELAALQWSACVDANPGSLTDYGLDAPVATCTVEWDGGSFTFSIGSTHDQGYHAAAEGDSRVYLLKNSLSGYLVDVLTMVNVELLTAVDVLKMDWGTVTSLDLLLDGETYTFTHADGTWKKDDETLELQNVLDELDDMYTDGTGTIPEEPVIELQLVMHRNTESFNPVTLTFYRLDGTNCVMQLDDMDPMLLTRSSVASLKEAFTTLLLG